MDAALQQQLAYYSARAEEYDEWWDRSGRFDRGAELNRQWFAEARELREKLREANPAGAVLELACGTGNWTEQLLKTADHVTAVDGSPEMLKMHRAKLGDDRITRLEVDLFSWDPRQQFDFVFFGFWLSHVPPSRFDAFWRMVGTCVKPGGRVCFIDSLRDSGSTAVDHALRPDPSPVQERRLNDGRTFEVFKVFYDPDALAARLKQLGWNAALSRTERFFLFGLLHPD